MAFGVISGTHREFVQWRIPNFLSVRCRKCDSPTFALAGCTWHLKLCTENMWLFSREDVSVTLCLDDPPITDKMVTCTFGLMKVDSTLEEKPSLKLNFKKRDNYLIRIWKWADLRERQSVLMHFGAFIITLRMVPESPNPGNVTRKQQEVVSELDTQLESKEGMLEDLEILSSDLKELFISERKSDVIINLQGKEYRAHRAVLSARSSVFRAMYEHDTAEDKSGVLMVPDCDPGTFGEFLNYLYTGKMEDMSFHTAYHLYATADKYDVQRLKTFCTDYLKRNLTVENVCEVVVLANRHCDEDLMSSAQVFFNRNFRRILLMSEWKTLTSCNLRLSNKLLEGLASS